MIIHGSKLDELYTKSINAIITFGKKSNPREMETTEIISPLLILSPQSEIPIIKNKTRELNYAFQIIEGLQYLEGTMDVERLCHYNKQMKNYVNERTGDFDGAYGPRMKRQINDCFTKLKRDKNSRQAVISIFEKNDHIKSKDVPCTLTLQFLIRDDKLDMIVNMRSNDVLWGTPYDIMCFTFIQHVMSSWLKVKPGSYYHHIGSFHFYDEQKEKIKNIIKNTEFENIDYGEYDLDVFETEKQLEIFWLLEKQSRIENVRSINVNLKKPFDIFINTIQNYNEKKYDKNKNS